jgi:beta-N-acetylhexosaminidase
VDVGRAGSNQERLGRSYSRRPGAVARLGGAFAEGLAAGNVAACAKHFPGLGAAQGDEDFHVNRIGLPLATLRSTDEAPFGALASAGVPLVMVSTALYPALDSRPALFSRRITTGELRDRLGFKGVSISDDLDTPAAARLGSPGERALASESAGIDLLLFAQSYGNAGEAERALVHASAQGHPTRAELEGAANRINQLRESLSTDS